VLITARSPRFMGHKTIQMTMRYAQLAPEHESEALILEAFYAELSVDDCIPLMLYSLRGMGG
jgi:hypothetical protein